MTDALAPALRAFLAEGRPVAIVTVSEAKGSTPREAGATMLVTADTTRGSIGGGQLELLAINRARELLTISTASASLDVPLGPEIGQCCGGHVSVTITRGEAQALPALEGIDSAAIRARPTVLVFGAGHVGRALVKALSLLPFQVRWVDERETEFGTAAVADNVEIVATQRWSEELRRAPPDAAYVVLTHSHSLDSMIVSAVLERGEFAYCGLIGSQTKRKVFERAFRDIGLPEASIARLVCPIGDRGVDDKRPEIIAALVVAELIEVFARQSPK